MALASSERDELTVERLVAAGSRLTGLQVIGFSNDWWDGQAHGPCLVVRGGRRDRRHPADKPVTPAHVAKTVYRAMGLHELTAVDGQNRPFQLLDDGEAITELF